MIHCVDIAVKLEKENQTVIFSQIPHTLCPTMGCQRAWIHPIGKIIISERWMLPCRGELVMNSNELGQWVGIGKRLDPMFIFCNFSFLAPNRPWHFWECVIQQKGTSEHKKVEFVFLRTQSSVWPLWPRKSLTYREIQKSYRWTHQKEAIPSPKYQNFRTILIVTWKRPLSLMFSF